MADVLTITNKNSEALLLVNQELGRLAQEANQAALDRNDARYPLNTKIMVGVPGANGEFKPVREVWGIDLSNTGIGLLAAKPFSRGEARSLMIPLPDDKQLYVMAIVQRCEQLTQEFYLVGATFIFDDITT